MKRMLVVAVALLSLLLAAGTTSAEPVNQFSFQITKLKPDGRFTLVFLARSYDTTGNPPPDLVTNYLRIPAGATLRKEFLNKKYFCDGPALRDALDRDRVDALIPFPDRVANLGPFIKRLSKSKSKRDRKAVANARVCEHARIGSGTANIDARASIPALNELVPSRFSLFFSKPTVPGAIAGFTVIGSGVARADIVRKYPIVAAVHVALTANFFNDPTPDGQYGYKLVLPPGRVAGLQVSIAELRVVNTGLTLLKGTCLKQGNGGKCVKQQKKTIFWFTTPKCPASGQLSFESFFQYTPPQPSETKTFSLPCPKFIL